MHAMMSDSWVCDSCKKEFASKKAWKQHRRKTKHGSRPVGTRSGVRGRRRSPTESTRTDQEAAGGDDGDVAANRERQHPATSVGAAAKPSSGGRKKRPKTTTGSRRLGASPAAAALTSDGWGYKRRVNSDNSLYLQHLKTGVSFRTRHAAVTWAKQNNVAPPRRTLVNDKVAKEHGGGLGRYFAAKSKASEGKNLLAQALPLPSTTSSVPTKRCAVCGSSNNPIARLTCVECNHMFPPRRRNKRPATLSSSSRPGIAGTCQVYFSVGLLQRSTCSF
jgi:hypothetical protein